MQDPSFYITALNFYNVSAHISKKFCHSYPSVKCYPCLKDFRAQTVQVLTDLLYKLIGRSLVHHL